MIDLIINHHRVPLSDGTELPMEYENPYFTKSSSYSLDIEVPIEYITESMQAFGTINRITTRDYPESMDAKLIVNGRCVFNGKAVPLSITDKTMTLQLLDGNSYFNYTAGDIYIDELPMGYFSTNVPYDGSDRATTPTSIAESEYDALFGSVDKCDVVFHPACNGNPDEFSRKYYLNPNDVRYGPNCIFVSSLYRFVCQPYLTKAIERVLDAAGYCIIRNDLNDSWLRNLYICNRYNRGTQIAYASTHVAIRTWLKLALPHWKLDTFIDEIEKLCACVFVIDDFGGVSIISLNRFYEEQSDRIVIPDDSVLDEYELEFEDETEEKDTASGNIAFDIDYSDKFLKVSPEVIASIEKQSHYANYTALKAAFDDMRESTLAETLFVDDSTGREYIGYKADENSEYVIKEVNIFGMLSRDGTSDVDVSLKMVPANTKIQNIGWWFSRGYTEPSAGLTVAIPYRETETVHEDEPETAQEVIEEAYETQKEESSDNIELMISTGERYHLADYQGNEYHYPAPFTDYQMNKSYKEVYPSMSLSLKDVCENSLGRLYRSLPNFRSNRKYVIRFLSPTLPDVKQIFLIHNQRYVCRKISVTYTQTGDTFLHEGEFYKLD